MKKPDLKLKMDGDSRKMTDAIDELVRLCFAARRTSKYQIKCGKVNFWPSTGKITVDGGPKVPKTGLIEFLLKIEEDLGHPTWSPGEPPVQPDVITEITVEFIDPPSEPQHNLYDLSIGELPF